jgi:hypothetical protein
MLEDAANFHRHTAKGFQCRCKRCNTDSVTEAQRLRRLQPPSTKSRQQRITYPTQVKGLHSRAEQIVDQTRSAAMALHAITDAWTHAWERGPI